MNGHEASVGVAFENSRRGSRRAASATMIVALVVSVTLNVLLAHKVRGFDSTKDARLADRLLKVGERVPSITAKRLDGGSEVISYQGIPQPTVLYVFTPTCIWCARNLSNLRTLVDKDGERYRFVALSLSEEGVAQFVAKNALGIPVYSGLSAETRKTYKLGGTPQTIVVSPGGRILQNWVGAYVGNQQSQVETFFHTTLPGLTAPPESSSATALGN